MASTTIAKQIQSQRGRKDGGPGRPPSPAAPGSLGAALTPWPLCEYPAEDNQGERQAPAIKAVSSSTR